MTQACAPHTAHDTNEDTMRKRNGRATMHAAFCLAESRYAFPVVEGIHLIGLSLPVGLITFVDLRLVGLFLQRTPLEDVLASLRPWLLWGFALTFASGLALFVAEATAVLASPVFPWKMAFVFLAGANALYFELRWHRRQTASAPSPAGAAATRGYRASGWASLALWALAVGTGRLLAYIPH